MFIGLAVIGFMSPVSAYSTPSTTLTDDNTVNTKQSASIAPSKPDRKHILNDEGKGLSAFFILGIVINIFMAITFTWWFSREWRRSKK